MLAKKYRLSRKQIILIHKKGRRLNFGQISFKFLPNQLGFGRYGVNVPTSVYKKAVQRNRLRRIIYQTIDNLSPGKASDFLINVYKPIDEVDIRKIIKQAFDQIR